MRSSRLFSTLFSFAVMLAESAAAQTPPRVWVASNGSDTDPCSRILPCRNFAAAIAVVGSGGEVVVLDSAGYGPVTIDKPVSIISPGGVHGAIAPTTGSAITVASGLAGPVVLRGLYLNGQGAGNGIWHQGNDPLFVESVVINGFNQTGFYLTGSPVFAIADSTVRNCSWGIGWFGSSPGGGVVERTRLENNDTGLYIHTSGNITVRNSVAAKNQDGFFVVADGAHVQFISSAAVLNTRMGFEAYSRGTLGVTVFLERCLSSRNQYGLYASSSFLSGAVPPGLFVSNCTITNNDVGLFAGDAAVYSRTNNTLEENGSGNTFPATTYAAK